MKKLISLVAILVLLVTATPVLAQDSSDPGLLTSDGVNLLRGAWGGTRLVTYDKVKEEPIDPPFALQINLYWIEFGVDPTDPGVMLATGYLSTNLVDGQKRAKAIKTPMMARYIDNDDGTFDLLSIVTTVRFERPDGTIATFPMIFTGAATTGDSGLGDDVMWGAWETAGRSGEWSATHLDRRKVACPEVEINGLSMWADVYAHIGPNKGAPGNKGTMLGVRTNIVSSAVRVNLPTGESVIVPSYTDVFSLDVDFLTSFRYHTRLPGLPVAGGIYTFTLLDALGNPIPGAEAMDIYVGGYIPGPPTDVDASKLYENGIFKGILMDWTEPGTILGAFQPADGIGFYQITVFPEEGDSVFGANQIEEPPHLIPNIEDDFGDYDHGTPLSEIEDGTYNILVMSLSVAPEGSAGSGLEAHVDCASADEWFFDVVGDVVSAPYQPTL